MDEIPDPVRSNSYRIGNCNSHSSSRGDGISMDLHLFVSKMYTQTKVYINNRPYANGMFKERNRPVMGKKENDKIKN